MELLTILNRCHHFRGFVYPRRHTYVFVVFAGEDRQTTALEPDGMPPIATRNPLRIGPGTTRKILRLQFSVAAPGYRSVCRLAIRNPLRIGPGRHARSPVSHQRPVFEAGSCREDDGARNLLRIDPGTTRQILQLL